MVESTNGRMMPTSELVDIDPKILQREGMLIGTESYGMVEYRDKCIMLGFACYKWQGSLYIFNARYTDKSETDITQTVTKVNY